MATTLLLWSSSQENSPEDLNSRGQESSEIRSEQSKSRSKRISKANASTQKKQPQRGLGVAQLERLRLQEQRKKLNEADNQVQYQFPFLDPQNAVSLGRFGAALSYGSLNGAQSSLQCVLQRYRLCNGGSGGRAVFSDQLCLDQSFRTAVNDARFQSQVPFTAEKVKELSSNQSLQCWSDQCEYCVKRKRMQSENLDLQGRRRMEGNSKEECEFLGLGLWSHTTSMEAEQNGLDVRAGRRGEGGMEVDEEVEVVAFQRKGKSVGESELMEYDFFPRKGGINSYGGKGSSFAEATVGEASSPPYFLDLSLKLSS